MASVKWSYVLRQRVVLDRWTCCTHVVEGTGDRGQSADDLGIVVTKDLQPKP